MEIDELGKIPIGPDLPSGEDVRYEPEYEALQVEIEKLSSPTSEGGADWNRVVALSTTILSEKSKNLLVASYLLVGLLNTKGLEALAPGMSMYRGIVEGFWDSLYPLKKRMRARSNALEWWLAKVLDFLHALPEDAILAHETKTALLEDVDAIDAFLAENMEDALLLHQLKSAVDAIPAEAESQPEEETQPERAPKPIPHPEPKPAPEAAKPAVEAPGAAAGEDSRKMFNQGLDSLRRAATLLRQQDPSNPLSYRSTRIAAWLELQGLPPAQDGKTLIPPPMEQIVTSLNNLYSQGNYMELMEYAESRVGQFLFWLDLSRYVAESLDRLGHQKALDAVVEETAQYARRLKGIEKLAFSDDTPFADSDTRDWLRDISETSGGGGPAGFVPMTHGGGESQGAGVAETYARAQALLKEKKLFEAVDLLQKDLNGAGSGKSRLKRRMGFARLLVSAKKPRLALPHLLEILEEIDRHGLENWNPGLALEALIQVYSGLKTQKKEKMQARAEEVLDRISRLNPAAAVRLEE